MTQGRKFEGINIPKRDERFSKEKDSQIREVHEVTLRKKQIAPVLFKQFQIIHNGLQT